jgi:hypothetical protein
MRAISSRCATRPGTSRYSEGGSGLRSATSRPPAALARGGDRLERYVRPRSDSAARAAATARVRSAGARAAAAYDQRARELRRPSATIASPASSASANARSGGASLAGASASERESAPEARKAGRPRRPGPASRARSQTRRDPVSSARPSAIASCVENGLAPGFRRRAESRHAVRETGTRSPRERARNPAQRASARDADWAEPPFSWQRRDRGASSSSEARRPSGRASSIRPFRR